MGEHAAYLKGQKARRQDKKKGDNPYGHATTRWSDNHHRWEKGWRDEDAIIKALSPESDWKVGKETVHV